MVIEIGNIPIGARKRKIVYKEENHGGKNVFI